HVAKPFRSHLPDQRDVREGFHVLDQRRTIRDAAFERAVRPGRRDRATSVDQVHEGALLACEIGRRYVEDADPRSPWLQPIPLVEGSAHRLPSASTPELDADDDLIR